jgi:hypothetical protein
VALGITSLYPADGAIGVERDTPQEFKVEHTGSNYLKILETTMGDFANGLLEGVDALADGQLKLSQLSGFNPPQANFEADTVGNFPANFFNYQGSTAAWTVQTFGGSKALRCVSDATAGGMVAYQGTHVQGQYEATVRIYFVDAIAEAGGIVFNLNQPFASRTGRLAFLDIQAQRLRMGVWDVASWQGENYVAKTIIPGEWWTIRIKNSYERYWCKAWKDGTSEPGTWDIGGTNGISQEIGTYIPGSIGLYTVTNSTVYFDALTITKGNTQAYQFYDSGSYALPYGWDTLVGGLWDTSHARVEWSYTDRFQARFYGHGTPAEWACYWKDGGSWGDFDLYWLVYPQNTQNEGGILFRFTTGTPLNGYCAKFNRPLSRFELCRCDGGTYTVVAYAAFSAGDAWYAVRIQAVGSAIKIKVFGYDDPFWNEPGAWLIEHTDATYSTGYFGVRHFDTGNLWCRGIRFGPQGTGEPVAKTSVYFNGSNNEIEAGSASALKPTTEVTVEGWVRKVTGAGEKTIIAWSNQYGYAMWWSGDNFVAGVRTDAGGGTWYATSGVAVSQALWHHLAMTYNGTTLKVYVDGVHQSGQDVSVSGSIAYTAGNLHMGNKDGGTTWAPIWLSDVRVWSVARSATQIADNRNGRMLGTETNLVGYWRMNEAVGTTIKDFTANASVGTLAGTFTNRQGLCTWQHWYGPAIDQGGGGTYVASGMRTSGVYSLATVGLVGGIQRIEWDAVTPSNTTLVMKTRVNGGTWRTVTNGVAIPDLALDDNVASGTLELRQELATTDTAVTPSVQEVRAIFQEQNVADVLLTVNGVDFTVANGGLVYWGLRMIGANPCLQKMTYRTAPGATWWTQATRQASVARIVKYNSVTKSSTTFLGAMVENIKHGLSAWWTAWHTTFWWKNAEGNAYYHVPDLLGACGQYIQANVFWHVVTPADGMMDAYWWVAHPFVKDLPESLIVGQPLPLVDSPESLVVNGWNPKDYSDSAIVQGWFRLDTQEALAVGVPFLRDLAAEAVIVGTMMVRDIPESGVVYQVNRLNGLELRILTVEEAALLASLGLLVE